MFTYVRNYSYDYEICNPLFILIEVCDNSTNLNKM